MERWLPYVIGAILLVGCIAYFTYFFSVNERNANGDGRREFEERRRHERQQELDRMRYGAPP